LGDNSQALETTTIYQTISSLPSSSLEGENDTATENFITGSFGDDRITGTNRSDIIIGLSGSDTINGGLGNDKIREQRILTSYMAMKAMIYFKGV
jgi:Ca2+-binding RTX toxin-like protein